MLAEEKGWLSIQYMDNSKKQSFATMYNAADQVLYQVKKSGKNRYEIKILG